MFLRLTMLAVAAVLSSELVFGQRVSFGFVGGTNLTRDFPISRTVYQDSDHPTGLTTFDLFSDTHSIIAGLSVEVDLRKGLSLEGNALHRKLHLKRRHIFPDGSPQDAGRDSVGTWEWPILLKYRMSALGAIRPFVEAGPSFRTRHNPAPTEPSQIGGTIGAGAEFRAGRLRVSPAIRYTRWQYDGDYPRIATKRDQIEFVTGISYATSSPSWKVRGRKLRFGLIGGTPLTGGFKQMPGPERIDESQGYSGGLAAEVELNRRFSIEVNGLYRPFRADSISVVLLAGEPVREYRNEFTVLTWQFPVLAKYRWRSESRIQPVVEAGPSFRLSGNLNNYNPSAHGFTAGGGVDTYYKALKIGPVLRYTRWAEDSGRYRGAPRTAPNQVELLVSFTF